MSRICADLDTEVAAFRDRSLAGMAFLYVFLDATCCKARVNHRVVSQAVVVATGVAAGGHREVLGFDAGDSEDGAFQAAFLRSLRARGLAGVQLVISDARAGLKAAIALVLLGAAWQRRRVHSCATCWPRSPRARRKWSPPLSALPWAGSGRRGGYRRCRGISGRRVYDAAGRRGCAGLCQQRAESRPGDRARLWPGSRARLRPGAGPGRIGRLPRGAGNRERVGSDTGGYGAWAAGHPETATSR